ncbi:MAG: NAD(P)/FAD-dependent oxidoreductase [Candidatus Niyogibacteria bacterium]|nr:NAD(P)/FAD-dependent oxidoreductase [Candidatus Niyogibacteria bacterium]
MSKERIVIVGGGFAGVRCARDLSRHVYKDAEIVLIDKNGYHEYHPNFYRIATTFLPHSKLPHPETYHELRDRISIPLRDIIDPAKMSLLIDSVTAIDAPKNTLTLASGKRIHYHWLVFAVGSVTNDFDIPGVEEFGLSLKTANDALLIRNAIDELFARTPKHIPIHIVIGGGGFTGCEVAASLACFMEQLSKVHSHPKENISLRILEAGDAILPGASIGLRKRAHVRLEKLGIKIHPRTRITQVKRDSILAEEILDNEDNPLKRPAPGGKIKQLRFPCALLLWTAGVKANPLADLIDRANKNPKACLMVNDYLEVEPYSNIFAIGDVAFCSTLEKPLPMTAQVAISQGKYIAYALKRIFHKRMRFRYYPHTARFIVPLGERYAIADLGWVILEGRSAWWLKRLATWDYLTGILPFWKALKHWRTSHMER